jgi:site-specific DNA recombinase
MIAAIYARKSTEQNTSDEEKSVTRQIERARAYAARKGWTIAEAHVYADDGISGAEFVKRPGFLRLMNSLRPAPPFQALIMSEESRLGRERIETEWNLKQITDAGVRVFYALADTEARTDDATSSFMGAVRLYAAQMEREQARQRTRDAMQRKAERGHVAGGTVYGYRNVRVADHVEREIVPDQAAVIRRIFELVAQGHGFARVAKALNADQVPCPRGRHWAMTGVRAMVFRDLYRGRIVWGRTRRLERRGTRGKQGRPEADWTLVEAEGLRIVSDESWQAAHARLDRTRSTYLRATGGRLCGRPVGGGEARYLLSGLVVCSVCGGSMHAIKRTGRRGAPRWYYTCNAWRVDGACTNNLSVPLTRLDAAVLAVLRDDVLTPELVEAVITRTIELARLEPEEHEQRRLTLTAAADRLHAEIGRLTAALADGAGGLASVVEAIRTRERERADVLARLEHLDGLSRAPEWGDGIRTKLRARLTEWRGLLGRQPEIARSVIRKLITGRLTLVPDAQASRYTFTGQASYDALLAGVVTVVPPG